MHNNAPIVLFTHKRLIKLQQTINVLASNFLASESDLIIYSDGPKNDEQEKIIIEIRKYLKTIKGFKSITINESKTNKGLANSIIDGVSEVMTKYHKAIVLEDDLICSTNFLEFMNQSLNRYKEHKNVYSISGYSFKFNHKVSDADSYFLNRHWPWGWASWEDRWKEVDWDLKEYLSFKKNIKSKKEFSLLGSDVNNMLAKQMNGKLDSWSIRWTYHIFKKNGMVLFPTISKISNNGWDIDATNTKGLNDRYKSTLDFSNKINFIFPLKIEINNKNQNALLQKMSLFSRLINKIKEIILK